MDAAKHDMNSGTSHLTIDYCDSDGNSVEMGGIYAGCWFAFHRPEWPSVSANADMEGVNDPFAIAYFLANAGHGVAAHELLKATYIGPDIDGCNAEWTIYDVPSRTFLSSAS